MFHFARPGAPGDACLTQAQRPWDKSATGVLSRFGQDARPLFKLFWANTQNHYTCIFQSSQTDPDLWGVFQFGGGPLPQPRPW
jgi:hypothetical protein